MSLTLEQLADHEAIRQCLMRYARAIDRMDEALLRQVYWPDAVDNHGTYNGPVEGFIEDLMPTLAAMDQTMHSLCNILIELDGDAAHIETYFTAFHRVKTDQGNPMEFVVGGRYIDRMERRHGEWRIKLRNVAYDWISRSDTPLDWTQTPYGIPIGSHRFPDDISYKFIGRTPEEKPAQSENTEDLEPS